MAGLQYTKPWEPLHVHPFPGDMPDAGWDEVLCGVRPEPFLLVNSSSSSASASRASSSGVFFFRISGFGSSWGACSCTSSFFLMLYCKQTVMCQVLWRLLRQACRFTGKARCGVEHCASGWGTTNRFTGNAWYWSSTLPLVVVQRIGLLETRHIVWSTVPLAEVQRIGLQETRGIGLVPCLWLWCSE